LYKELALRYYKDDNRLNKALAAGIAIDNALIIKYTKSGITNSKFLMNNYLKYFTYENLPKLKTNV
jgi:hypothetical protein